MPLARKKNPHSIQVSTGLDLISTPIEQRYVINRSVSTILDASPGENPENSGGGELRLYELYFEMDGYGFKILTKTEYRGSFGLASGNHACSSVHA